jgi:hypothetical protein
LEEHLMIRTITLAAASAVALVALGACSRGDSAAYDSTAGATAGAMATPATTPPVGMSTGATTSVIDSTKQTTKKP